MPSNCFDLTFRQDLLLRCMIQLHLVITQTCLQTTAITVRRSEQLEALAAVSDLILLTIG